MEPTLQQLAEFIIDMHNEYVWRGTNRWLKSKKQEIYIRRGLRLVPSDLRVCFSLDLANFNTYREFQGQGLVRSFVEEAHKMNPWPMTFIENVHNPRFQTFFEREGYIPYPKFGNCYYKLTGIPIEDKSLAFSLQQPNGTPLPEETK